MTGNYPAVVITSDETFGKTKHTQLLYAEWLSKHTEVLFIGPPEPWRPQHLFRWSWKKQKQNERLTTVTYLNVLPSSLSVSTRANERINGRQLLKYLQALSADSVVLWHFDSFRSVFRESLNGIKNINRLYHVIDPFYNNPFDNILRKIAALIVVTSPRIAPHYKTAGHKILQVPQVIDVEEARSFLHAAPPAVLPKNKYVVLLGTISSDTDFILLERLLAQGITLLVIGKIIGEAIGSNRVSKFFSHPNMTYAGEMGPQEFYPTLRSAQAGIIAYTAERRGRPFSPLKALNYLVAGIPVISNCDCEISLGECIYVEEDSNGFTEKVQAAVDGTLKFNREAASDYLSEVSIETATHRIISALEKGSGNEA